MPPFKPCALFIFALFFEFSSPMWPNRGVLVPSFPDFTNYFTVDGCFAGVFFCQVHIMFILSSLCCHYFAIWRSYQVDLIVCQVYFAKWSSLHSLTFTFLPLFCYLTISPGWWYSLSGLLCQMVKSTPHLYQLSQRWRWRIKNVLSPLPLFWSKNVWVHHLKGGKCGSSSPSTFVILFSTISFQKNSQHLPLAPKHGPTKITGHLHEALFLMWDAKYPQLALSWDSFFFYATH
jgi:hypothetical protein